ncbi:BlaI/MecI/CopY family transcriptional regulator [Ferrimicrobium acidiphilum]|uniref:BlaI/MecI/CopY family transcriptional regulator n=2 Tax=Ferrimicrobium acidiphilum TaxID=121039 RepID=UPI0023F2B6C6|nr:BlaI/MecI/CopY family transcriptional regulator [Ferrimicrobium acidiphilum]
MGDERKARQVKRNSIAGIKVGQLEERVMGVLLNVQRPLTGREIHDGLGEPRRAYTTVMTILNRLVEKGLVNRANEDGVFRYSVIGGIDRLAAKEIDRLLATSEDPRRVLMYFVDEIHDETLLAELAELIERQQDS